MKRSRTIFLALDGLRFLAALSVVCFHYAPLSVGFFNLPAFLRNLIRCGPIALPFFYILSGFVLSHAYVHRIPTTPEARHAFWFARIARLYPVYLTAWVMFLPMAYFKYLSHNAPQEKTFVVGGLLSLVALQAWTPLSQVWNGPSWSLSVEAFFYFLFPFLALPLLKVRYTTLLTVVATSWAAMLTLTISYLHGTIPKQIWMDWIGNNPIFWTPMFLFGIASYRLCSWFRQWRPIAAGLVALGSLGVLVVLCGFSSPALGEFLVNGGSGILMTLVVLSCAHANNFTARALGSSTIAKLGTVSFIIYITESPVWHIWRMAADKLKYETAGQPVAWGVFPSYVLLLVCFSILLQGWVERPAHKWLLSRASVVDKATANALEPNIEAT